VVELHSCHHKCNANALQQPTAAALHLHSAPSCGALAHQKLLIGLADQNCTVVNSLPGAIQLIWSSLRRLVEGRDSRGARFVAELDLVDGVARATAYSSARFEGRPNRPLLTDVVDSASAFKSIRRICHGFDSGVEISPFDGTAHITASGTCLHSRHRPDCTRHQRRPPLKPIAHSKRLDLE
jgi:hypothetical protein